MMKRLYVSNRSNLNNRSAFLVITNMFCPRCSNEYSEAIAYCRSCGLGLDEVTRVVAGEAENAPEMVSRPNFKLMRFGIGLFIFGTVVALATAAVRDFELFPEAYGRLVFMAIIAAGMLLMAIGFLFPMKQYKKRKPKSQSPNLDSATLKEKLNPASANDIVFPINTRELEPVAISSVTENTTRNLSRKD